MTTSWPPPNGVTVRTSMDLGAAIRGARSARSWTQADLADRAGVGREWLVAVERGRHVRAEVGMVLRVLAALNVTLRITQASEPEDGTRAPDEQRIDLGALLDAMSRRGSA